MFEEELQEKISFNDEEIFNQYNAEEVDSGEDNEENYRDESASSRPLFKRGATQNNAPRLIDDKCKPLERKLSATQRDCSLLNEAKEDKETKKQLAKATRGQIIPL